MRRLWVTTAVAATAAVSIVHAQVPVTASTNADSLFESVDSKLHSNKQVVYHLIKDVLVAGHVELAGRYVSERYIQHNPNIASGRAALISDISALEAKREIPAHIPNIIVSVVAEGDMVTVAQVVKKHASGDASRTYTTTDFDMWRIRDGKADEHWDNAILTSNARPPPTSDE